MSPESGARARASQKASVKVLLFGLVLILANGTMGLLPLGSVGEIASYALFAVLMLSAIAILGSVALKFDRGSSVRRQWGLLSIGVALGIVGDIVYLVQGEVTGSAPPFPSWAVPIYLVQYGFLLASMISAGLAYKAIISPKKPALVAAALAAAIAAALIWTQLSGVFYSMPADTRTEAVFFTIADMMLIFAPAMFVVLVLLKLGAANFARPWKAVGAGAMLFAFGDIMNFSMGAFSGDINAGVAVVGMTRMASALLFAVAILMAREAFSLDE